MEDVHVKIVVIGASGIVGSAVAEELTERGHEVVRASRRGPVVVDLPDLDGVVCCAANAPTADLVEAADEDFLAGLPRKLLGQVRRRVRHADRWHVRRADAGRVVRRAGQRGAGGVRRCCGGRGGRGHGAAMTDVGKTSTGLEVKPPATPPAGRGSRPGGRTVSRGPRRHSRTGRTARN
ncbi:NAD-dependent epimerase/dehydratase family protein [Jiangella muralis]|uniref:NAD-dependent epimerase/dehydratase family protein n=1 Tax=Jiangella muralis TaxID=702383 RepID=UPI003B849BB3